MPPDYRKAISLTPRFSGTARVSLTPTSSGPVLVKDVVPDGIHVFVTELTDNRWRQFSIAGLCRGKADAGCRWR